MGKLDEVRAAFHDLIGVSGDAIQEEYGVWGDWCCMTVYLGFKHAGLLDLFNGGEPTAWVPDAWDYYNARGMTGRTPRAGALTFFDYNGNGTPDHIEFCDSADDDGTFNDISGNSGRDYVFSENVGMSGVLGFAYPDYGAEEKEQKEEDYNMECIFRPNGENYLVFYDGHKIHILSHPDEVTAINMVHKNTKGRDIPIFELGTAESPWATRFIAAAER